MEEKERYILEPVRECHVGNPIIDTQNNIKITNYSILCDLLNQQDKRIKELEQENQQLKQQLDQHDKRIKEFEDFMKEEEFTGLEDLKAYIKLQSNASKNLIQENQQLKQTQKQLAISELEALARFSEENAYYYEEEQFAKQINKYISKKIKLLKGEE